MHNGVNCIFSCSCPPSADGVSKPSLFLFLAPLPTLASASSLTGAHAPPVPSKKGLIGLQRSYWSSTSKYGIETLGKPVLPYFAFVVPLAQER